MDTYSFLRQLADSWVLLAMTAFFLGAILWSLRLGSRQTHHDIAAIPFRNDTAACPNNCPDCTCKVIPSFLPEDRA